MLDFTFDTQNTAVATVRTMPVQTLGPIFFSVLSDKISDVPTSLSELTTLYNSADCIICR